MEILNQLGSLVLGAVPTAILFTLLVILYDVLLRRPMEKVLAERRERTFGAVDQARSAIAEAETRTAAYEQKLREARAQLASAREQRLKQLHGERDRVVEATRAQAQEMVRAARKEIEDSSTGARTQIEEATAELSQQILRALMPKQVALGEVTR
jgi:F-type H+-transporting ATPase subunit b